MPCPVWHTTLHKVCCVVAPFQRPSHSQHILWLILYFLAASASAVPAALPHLMPLLISSSYGYACTMQIHCSAKYTKVFLFRGVDSRNFSVKGQFLKTEAVLSESQFITCLNSLKIIKTTKISTKWYCFHINLTPWPEVMLMQYNLLELQLIQRLYFL